MSWFKRGKPARPLPLDEQLRILSACGVNLATGVDTAALTSSLDAAQFEADPFRLALTMMGNEAVNPGQAGPSGFLSDDIWHFDTECIEGDGSYTRIAARLVTLAKGAFPLESIQDHVDVEGGTAWLGFRLDGKSHRLEAEVQDDWVDTSVLSRLAALLRERSGAGRRFTYIDLGGQDCLIGCATPDQKAQMQKQTGLEVGWLD